MHFAFHIFLEHKRMWQLSVSTASALPYSHLLSSGYLIELQDWHHLLKCTCATAVAVCTLE